MKSTARSAPQRAGKPRGTKGHFFTAPVTPAGARPARPAQSPKSPRSPRSAQARPMRDAPPQRTRPARAPAWDDDGDAAGATPSSAVARGTKVRSRRPTGAQELRALRLREQARAQEVARRPRQAAAAYTPAAGAQPVRGQRPADGRTAGARPAWPPAREAVKPRVLPPKRALPPPPPVVDFLLHGEHIALDNLLKLTGLAPSGGAAKALAAAGAVQVDGQVELRKTCKIRAGQMVQTAHARIRVAAAAQVT